ncbi:MAG: hypothetical protein M3R15_34445 [Acidobacteriota bacterium]|nr:hypothetical protein [Acidobacteriota bacterium]
MIPVAITTVFLLAVAAYFILRPKLSSSNHYQHHNLTPTHARRVFGNRHILFAVLLVIGGVPVLSLLWSLIARLLNAKSDTSVMLGWTLFVATLGFVGVVIYRIITALVTARHVDAEPDEKHFSMRSGEQPKGLFSEDVNLLEHFNETDRSKHFRE